MFTVQIITLFTLSHYAA